VSPATVPGPGAQAPSQLVAQADTGGPRWDELNPGQREVLAPLAHDWDSFDSRSKERWVGVASRFHKMPPAEQQRANARMVQWARLSPQERSRARLNYQELRSVSKEERQARWQAYQALPEEQKRALAERAAAAAVPTGPASAAALAHRRHPPLEAIQPKTNVVSAARETGTPVEPGSPVLEMRPGATTTLVNRKAAPPAHQKEGQPKINAGANYVDRTTLLPKHGAQEAGNGRKAR
jgi:hypothetical protein